MVFNANGKRETTFLSLFRQNVLTLYKAFLPLHWHFQCNKNLALTYMNTGNGSKNQTRVQRSVKYYVFGKS